MRVDVLNGVEAEDYASEIVGNSVDDYEFAAEVYAVAQDPETAYEAVNQSTNLRIEGLTEIAQDFDEDEFPLEVAKRNYVRELDDIIHANNILQENGFDFETEISVRTDGQTPREAIRRLERTEITGVLTGEKDEYETAVIYNPDGKPQFQPTVHPTKETTPEEALERKQELEDTLRELNII